MTTIGDAIWAGVFGTVTGLAAYAWLTVAGVL